MILDKKRKSIKAFHDVDLEKILDKLNINKVNIRCNSCNKLIDKNNIGGLLKKKGKILVYCNRLSCTEEALELQKCGDHNG